MDGGAAGRRYGSLRGPTVHNRAPCIPLPLLRPSLGESFAESGRRGRCLSSALLLTAACARARVAVNYVKGTFPFLGRYFKGASPSTDPKWIGNRLHDLLRKSRYLPGVMPLTEVLSCC